MVSNLLKSVARRLIPGPVKRWLKDLLGITELVHRLEEALTRAGPTPGSPLAWAPPGHFYSPIPDPVELHANAASIFAAPPRSLPGIELNERRQLELLEELAGYYDDIDFPEDAHKSHRYHYRNEQYTYSDAICLYGMLRHLQPERIIEIGSGYSSCVMLDTNERYFNYGTSCTFIEPYPDRLLGLIRKGDRDRFELLEKRVQDVELERFRDLRAKDILFVDSTHVSKTHSDVNHLIFEVLPELNKGVYIHFHDIFFPFEYPKNWVLEGRAWNEAYFLRAFLSHNTAFEIVLMNTFLHEFHRDRLEQLMPLSLRNPGGSLWLCKI
jgi:hypothetical protein